MFTRVENAYDKIEKIGEGAYGEVWKAINRETKQQVALKKIKLENESEGFPLTALREIKLLKKLQHKNIVGLVDVVSEGNLENVNECKFYLVFEYVDHDMTGLVYSQHVSFTVPQLKCYLKQLLEGVFHCHAHNVLHRDIKTSNLLVSNQGILKLADFGLSRQVDNDKCSLTNRVVTIWYRPPELLYGSRKYTASVDMWSVGCVIAEMILRRPLFPGSDEGDQLSKIIELCGTPTVENWPTVDKLDLFPMLKPKLDKPRQLLQHLKSCGVPSDAADLIDKLLQLDPEKRMTAHDALNHDYFWQEPLPAEPSSLPNYHGSLNDLRIKKLHEEETKKRKIQEAQQNFHAQVKQQQMQLQLQLQLQQQPYIQQHSYSNKRPRPNNYNPSFGYYNISNYNYSYNNGSGKTAHTAFLNNGSNLSYGGGVVDNSGYYPQYHHHHPQPHHSQNYRKK